ncbi:MAG: hypothetical protein AAB403_01020 [Planctomycetota bacterium]
MKNRKMNDQVEQCYCLNFYGLEELCDDPKRDETKQEVQAVLTSIRSGYALSARDGDQIYKIVDERGRQVRFKTIAIAVDRLSDVPHLFPVLEVQNYGCREVIYLQ